MESCARLLLILCCLWFSAGPGIAEAATAGHEGELIRDDGIRRLFYRGLTRVYQFDFDDAEQDARRLTSLYGEAPWGYVLTANICWWKLVTGEDNATNRNAFLSGLTRAEAAIPDLCGEESLFCQIVIHSLRSRYSLLQRDYLSMLRQLNESRDLLRRSEGKEVHCEPYLLTRGLFLYFMAAAKEKMGILSYLLDYRSDKDLGIGYLERLSRSTHSVLKAEGNYFLMKIYFDMEHDPVKAKPHSDYLVTQYPANLIFCYYNLRINEEIYGPAPAGLPSCNCLSFLGSNPQLSEAQRKYLSALLGQKQ